MKRSLMYKKILVVAFFAATFFLWCRTVLLVNLSPLTSPFYDLEPAPDAKEYFAMAMQFLREGSFQIYLDGSFVPSRYPFAYSFFMALVTPFLKEPIAAPYVVNLLFSAALIFVFAATAHRLFGALASAIGTLQLVALPLFSEVALTPMSEISATFFLLTSMGLWLIYAKENKSFAADCAAVLFGMSLYFREAFVFYSPVLLVSALLIPRLAWAQRAGRCVRNICLCLGSLLPLLWYQWHFFGNPFETGYHQWGFGHQLFQVKHILPNLAAYAQTILGIESLKIGEILSKGSLVLPVLLLCSLICGLRRRMWLLMTLPIYSYLGAMLFYHYSLERFLFPVLAFLVLLLTFFISVNLQTKQGGKVMITVALSILLCASIIGFRGMGQPPALLTVLDSDRFPQLPAREYLLVRAVEQYRQSGHVACLIFTDIYTPYFYALSSGQISILPLAEAQPWYHTLPFYRYDPSKQGEYVRETLSNTGCIMAALLKGLPNLGEKIPPPVRYVWRTIYKDAWGAEAAVLSSRYGFVFQGSEHEPMHSLMSDGYSLLTQSPQR